MPSSFFRSRGCGGASLWHLLSRTAPRGQHQGHSSVPPWASPCNTQRLSWEGHCSSTSPACQPSPAPAQLSESHTGASGATESSGQPGTATSLPSLPPSPSSLSLVTPGGLVPLQWPREALSKQSKEPSPAHSAAASPSTSPALELLGRAPFLFHHCHFLIILWLSRGPSGTSHSVNHSSQHPAP